MPDLLPPCHLQQPHSLPGPPAPPASSWQWLVFSSSWLQAHRQALAGPTCVPPPPQSCRTLGCRQRTWFSSCMMGLQQMPASCSALRSLSSGVGTCLPLPPGLRCILQVWDVAQPASRHSHLRCMCKFCTLPCAAQVLLEASHPCDSCVQLGLICS